MDRKEFLKNGLIAGATVVTGTGFARGNTLERLGQDLLTKHEFKLKYSPHFGMFRHHAGEDLIDQISFMSDIGFKGLEDNGMKQRGVTTQERIGKALIDKNLEMGVFVAHTIYWDTPTLSTGDPAFVESFLKEIQESVDVAKRVGAKWMTVVPGFVDMKLDMNIQELNLIDTLKRASEILEKHDLVMVLEPLNTLRDHPGMILTGTTQAYRICRHVDSPSCKILYDAYHQSITEGNMIPNMMTAWDEIPYIQIGDHPGRNEPGTGEINYRNIFKFLHQQGYDGIVGMEHGKSSSDKNGELKLIAAYLDADDFEPEEA